MPDLGVCTGKSRRMERLFHPVSETTFLVPLDHSLANGPVTSADGFTRLVRTMSANGVDGIVVHKGRVRFLSLETLGQMALVVHLSGSTRHAPDADAKILVGAVEEAVALGADGISLHVNVGSNTEAAQLRDLGAVADQCARWGLPLLAMVYPRGPRVADPTDPTLLAHAANIAADLGADIVKVPYTGRVDTMGEVIESSPIPVVTAGGSVADDVEDFLDQVESTMSSGVHGVAVGRNVFAAQDPGRTARSVAERVHVLRGARERLVPIGAGIPA